MSGRSQIDTVLKQVRSWPVEDRLALTQELLREIHASPLAPPPRNTLSRALGILRGNGPIPSDEDVKRIIEEERLAKYGK